jgi:hypothetical protein
MRMSATRRGASRLAALAACLLLLAACSSGVRVSIANHSAYALTDITISGRGFAESLSSLPAGGSEVLHVRPRGESGVKVSFAANGERHSSMSGFDENELLSAVSITVAEDLSISIDTNPD